jgi:hypothetical protein
MQLIAFGNQFSNDLVQRIEGAVNFTITADLTVAALFGNGNLYGIFMNIHTDKCAILLHGLPPCLWLCDG